LWWWKFWEDGAGRYSRYVVLEKVGKDGRIRRGLGLHMKGDEYVGVDSTYHGRVTNFYPMIRTELHQLDLLPATVEYRSHTTHISTAVDEDKGRCYSSNVNHNPP